MESAKKVFELERDKILSELPDDIKASFGQIGFVVHHETNEVVPVLIMSPYHVPPKPVRDIYWFDMFSKAKKAKKLDELNYLVYWYGSDDPDDCYSFVEHEDFVTLEVGLENGYDKLPEALQAKVDAATDALTEDEQAHVRAIQELHEDLAKEPGERRRGIDFKERHEMLKAPPPKKKGQKTKH